MKIKFLLPLLSFFFVSIFATYASFPVERSSNTKTENVSSKNSNVSVDELTSPATVAGGKSQIIAAILCFAIGVAGIHRFYLGYTWQGVVQLLTGGGCGIWALIDLIRICTGDLQPKNGPYDKTF